MERIVPSGDMQVKRVIPFAPKQRNAQSMKFQSMKIQDQLQAYG